jgi:uncharacterized PurR-regulated membrane protein YhhQ (DUF165 family)
MKKPIKPVSPEAKVVMKNYHKEKAKKYGMEYIEPTQPKWFVSYPFMIAIMAGLQVLATIYGRLFFDVAGIDASVGNVLLLPIVLYCFQIVAECYGWQYARQIIWANFIVNGIITAVTFLITYIPISSMTHEELKFSYVHLLGTVWVSAAITWVVVFFSDYVTSALMCESKFQFNGRFLLLRMIILHCLAEAILVSGGLIILPFNGYSMHDTIHIMLGTFTARTVSSVIMLPFARFAIWVIQHKVEKVIVFDLHARFNPFKFGINPAESVQFNADGWDRIDRGKINLKKMAEYYSNGILEEQHQKMVDSMNKRNQEQQQAQ